MQQIKGCWWAYSISTTYLGLIFLQQLYTTIQTSLQRIIEHPKLERTHTIHWVRLLTPHPTTQKSDHMSKSVVQTHLELWQACSPEGRSHYTVVSCMNRFLLMSDQDRHLGELSLLWSKTYSDQIWLLVLRLNCALQFSPFTCSSILIVKAFSQLIFSLPKIAAHWWMYKI